MASITVVECIPRSTAIRAARASDSCSMAQTDDAHADTEKINVDRAHADNAATATVSYGDMKGTAF